MILEIKSSCTNNELCYGLPIEILLLLRYVKTINSFSTPNYAKINNFVRDLIESVTKSSQNNKAIEDNESVGSRISESSESSFNPMKAKIFQYYAKNNININNNSKENNHSETSSKYENSRKRNIYQGKKSTKSNNIRGPDVK
mmetsp:Transcript_11488/g.10155  ORF Transcript_11488/g.10155 Transcript_11488/m.10155 type:complete len:143 (+) Transcript_11488:467-895(+)